MQPSISRRSLLNYLGIAILMVGMGLGEFIYWRGLHGERTNDDDLLLTPETSRAYERSVGMYVGSFGLVVSRATAKLSEPRTLAITISVASMLTASGFFLLAARLPRD